MGEQAQPERPENAEDSTAGPGGHESTSASDSFAPSAAAGGQVGEPVAGTPSSPPPSDYPEEGYHPAQEGYPASGGLPAA